MKLNSRVCNLSLQHPVMNGSGLLGATRQQISIMCSWGLAAIVTKTITRYPRVMNKPPNILYLSDLGAIINSLGLPNPGAERLHELVQEAKAHGLPTIVSVGGSSVREYIEVSSRAEEAGADAVELNLSCPTTSGYGLNAVTDSQVLYEIVKNVSSIIRLPVIAKLGIDLRNGLISLVGKALEGGAKAVTLINSVRVVSIDPERLAYSLSSSNMGYSGAPIFYVGLRAVHDVYREYKAEIIGCGGIRHWGDVASYILAGARAVQLVTSLMRARKPGEYLNNLLRGLEDWLERKGFSSLEEAIGYIHRI
ncbi:MAG: tRNA-dihydrouridine synthase [Zestosphaera sp.]